MKKNKYWFIVLIVVIVLLTILFYFLNSNINKINKVAENKIIVEYNNLKHEVTLNELFNMDGMSFNTVIRSTNIKNKRVEYTGVELGVVFKNLEIDIDKINKITVISTDSYRITLHKEEIKSKNNVFLVYKKNNRFIRDINDSIRGAFHLIIRQDYFSQRWVKGVNKIILK